MGKFVFAWGLLAVLVLLEFFGFGFKAISSSEVLTVDGEPSLQEWFDLNGYAINVTVDEMGIETFEAGYYRVSILAEIAVYAPFNNLSWYLIGDGQLKLLFLGENSTGDTAYFMADDAFGLCLGSPEGYFYTETWRNEDEKDHALVFMNPKASGYIIAWEDLWSLGDADFQDFILAALTPVNVSVRYFPRTLNLKSKGRWITAIVRLPKNYNVSDVDVSSIMLNGTVPADQRHYEICECLNLIVLKFNGTAVIEMIKESLNETLCKKKFVKVSLTLTGRFLDGIPFQGTDKIRVVHFECHKHAFKKWQCKPSYHPVDAHATQP
ncbi:MAG: DUF4114 domain-containing protein [Candidatus Bathycorpusculaceae bacterium]